MQNKTKYFTVRSKSAKLANLREFGVRMGVCTGWADLSHYVSLKRGFPIYIAGQPFSGKTEFLLDLLLNTSILYGWKHLIYSGESGDVQTIIAELSHKFIGKPFFKKINNKDTSAYCMSDAEMIAAQIFLDKYFYFIDTEDPDSEIERFNIDQFYKEVNEIENELGFTFDTVSLDPFMDLEFMRSHSNRLDLHIDYALRKTSMNAKKNNRINILVTHIADITPIVDKDTRIRYIPPALPSEWAGGKYWWKRGYTLLNIYRPDTRLMNEHGQPYKDNEMHVIIQKSKPKGTGKLGKFVMYYDFRKNTFYYIDSTGNVVYPKRFNEINFKKIENNINFEQEKKTETENKIINNNSMNDTNYPDLW